MFRSPGSARDNLEDLSRVEKLTRDRFRIDPSNLVLVSEDPGEKPGYPARETNVIFWIGGDRYRFRIFAPVAEIGASDLPVSWLLPGLRDNGDIDCC